MRVNWRADPHALLDAAVAAMGGERREGQHELTAAVADAISDGHHLLAEAPTGSGKSLAYLVAAVASGLKVVVATSTIALQSQLTGKDLPALKEGGGVDFTYALLKGRSNYLCRAKLRAAAAPDALFEQPVGQRLRPPARAPARLRRAVDDRRSLRPRTRDQRRHVASRDVHERGVSRARPTATTARSASPSTPVTARRARRSSSSTTRSYCAHLASERRVLPEHDVVIIDEAHAFAENATNAFAGDVAADAIVRLSGMLTRSGVDAATVNELSEAGRALGACIEARDGTVHVGADQELDQSLLRTAELLARANGKLVTAADEYAKRTAKLVLGRLDVLRRLAAPGDGDVVWVERIGRTPRLRDRARRRGRDDRAGAAPVASGDRRVGDARRRPALHRARVPDGFPARRALGSWGERDDEGAWTANPGRGYAAVQTPSSFDWREQGILFVGKDLPDPGRARDDWMEVSANRLCSLVNAAGGRALVLCTSRANVDRFSEVLRKRTDHRILTQGDRDAGRLTKEFVEDETSVLVGTRSFWAGIDAAGAACVLVVIDKIPFPVPDEPLHAARRARAQQRGIDAFVAVDLPAAALVLAQGAGRLIRTRSDRGVVAVLDPRLAKQAVPGPTARGDAAAPSQHRPEGDVRLPRGDRRLRLTSYRR